MRWVLEHLQVLIVIAGAIAYYVNQRRRQREGLPPEEEEGGAFDTGSMEAEEAERTRRLQEELRLKREQRAGAVPPVQQPSRPVRPQAPRPAAPPPVFQDPLAEMMKDIAKRLAPVPVPAPVSGPTAEEQAVLQRQRELELRMQDLEVQRRATLAKASAVALGVAGEEPRRAESQSGSWLRDLQDPRQIRRAVVMNEILGRPAGLR